MSIFCCGGRRSPVEYPKKQKQTQDDYRLHLIAGAGFGAIGALYLASAVGFFTESSEDGFRFRSLLSVIEMSEADELEIMKRVHMKIGELLFPIVGIGASCGAMVAYAWEKCSRPKKQG